MKFCTHMAYIFVESYTKFEVDGSVRYRDIVINVKWGKNPPPAARALIVFEIYGSYLSINNHGMLLPRYRKFQIR